MRTLRVATFNIRHGLGRDRRIDLERTAAAMRACEAGFIALQEVDRKLRRSRRADQAAVLGELTGMQSAFFATVERRGGQYGIGVTALAPLQARYLELPRLTPDEEPRGVIIATWRGVSFLATHMSLVRATRAAQNQALIELAEGLPPPVVVLGDLNQDREELEPLLAAGYDPGPDRPTTFHGRRAGRQIDYVLGGRGAKILGSWTVASSASDHVPLVAEVAIEE